MAINELNRCIQKLTLPGESFESLSFCSASPEGVKEYLEQLPHGNAAELCNQLYHLLPEIAGLQISPGRKLALLDLVRPEAIGCVERITRNLAITPATTKVLSLSIAMLRYLAEGYKSVLVGAIRLPASPPNIVVSATYSAINVLSQILMECWECYVAPPRNTWVEIHNLYCIARLSNLENISISSHRITAGIEATIKAAYVKPLLLACADPARYAPQELRQIMAYLTGTGNLVDFTVNHSEGVFIIDPESDTGPQYSFKVPGTTSRHYRLRATRLVRYIEEQIAVSALSGISTRVGRDLCKYWSREIQRREEPVNDSTPMTVIFGLGHIHRQLTETASVDEYLAKLRKFGKTLSLEDMEDGEKQDHRDVFIKGERQDKWHTLTNRGIPRGNGDKPIEYTREEVKKPLRHYTALRTNYSSAGARLELAPQGEILSPGELVAFQPENSDTWILGLARWTRIDSRLTRRVGVQLLKESVTPCVVSQVTAGSDGTRQHYPGLLMERDGKPAVVVPALPFREYSFVQIDSPAGKRNVRLLGTAEETYHVACFNLELSPSSVTKHPVTGTKG